ncbi:tol-pal system protein YbgF [Pseudogulbenkiania sp. NH8B]|uniref:tol-pal system protein YbgF n=1 Tax=Pseudogulbenkiania sp. (strain NH8B) TaxID=748280 RepID=UPI00022791E6|nr:tol-pal system protein YbgF [Pseudogulbenkiania sp. NH8B]BAK75082.1 tol-pal system protein YbgF [Pseudogulbenkiania sp. NH8B]
MKRLALGALLLTLLAGCATTTELDDTRSRLEDTRRQLDQINRQANTRLTDVETKLSNDKLLAMISELESLKAEQARLRGELEVQGYNLQNTQKRQNDLYADLDARLAKLEGGAPASSASPASSGATDGGAPSSSAPAATPASSDYDKAIALLRNRDFPHATEALKRFIDQNPGAVEAVDAMYWLGVAHAAQRQYDAAIDIHRRFVERNPNHPKAPDALRNIANCQRDLGQVDVAKATLHRLIKLYPKSAAAVKAKEQLKQM